MRCPYCNNKVNKNSKFCPTCGKEIIREMVCPKCGGANSLKNIFCEHCGAQLSNDTVEVQAKKSAFSNEKLHNLFSIISMGLMLLSLLLIIGLSFSPFLKDDFFPDSAFTIITNVSNTFDIGISKLVESNRYVELANAFIALVLLIANVVLGIVFIGTSVPKIIDGIKNKKYHDFSKKVVISYILFLGTIIYCANFFFKQGNEMTETYHGGIIFGLIIIAVFLSFNLFTKEFKNKNRNLVTTILKSSFSFIIVVLTLLLCFFVAGSPYSFSENIYDPGSMRIPQYYQTGNMGLISHFISLVGQYTTSAEPIVLNIFIFSSISLLLEILTFVLAVQLLFEPLSKNIRDNKTTIASVIVSGIVVLLSISVFVFNPMVNTEMNKLDDPGQYWVSISSTLSDSHTIAVMVLASLLFIIIAASFITEQIHVKKEEETDEEIN